MPLQVLNTRAFWHLLAGDLHLAKGICVFTRRHRKGPGGVCAQDVGYTREDMPASLRLRRRGRDCLVLFIQYVKRPSLQLTESVSLPSSPKNQRRWGKAEGLNSWLQPSPSGCCSKGITLSPGTGCAFQSSFVSLVSFFSPANGWRSLCAGAKSPGGSLQHLLRES